MRFYLLLCLIILFVTNAVLAADTSSTQQTITNDTSNTQQTITNDTSNTQQTTTITEPTKSSAPIPSLQKTQNIDTVLSEKVQSIISNIPSLEGQSISASSQNQIITLEGSVDNKTQEAIAIRAAQSVQGVKGVKSQLTIK